MRGISQGFVLLLACVATTIFALVLADCIGGLRGCSSRAYANGGELAVLDGVQKLSPRMQPAVAASWAGVLFEAAREQSLDPLLLTALAFRESSFREGLRGDLGEEGAMQLLGVAKRAAPRGRDGRRCDTSQLRCNIRTGAAFLAWCRERCPGPWDVWVGAYGMSRCPTAAEAREHRSVKRARLLYEQIGGSRWE